ncbi:MAG: DUF1499 domain-containing protein [Nitrospirales bacterium]|nr:DUF1499 domain-containing protein [Nitrospirales bacterium]MBA3967852.1 DUF1499 domain-containing protein [Nitrospirales bacterium]
MLLCLIPSAGLSLAATGEELIVRERHTFSCPDSPNCVSTMAATESQAIAPYRYQTSMEEAKALLKQVYGQFPRTELSREEEDYLQYEVKSFLFGFVDDVELWFDETAKIIHFRSAARSGYYDFGVNRKRMEGVRQMLEGKL